jgi:hypothetical protein
MNVSLTVTDLLARSLENACKDAVSQAIKECGKMYNFNAEEAMGALGLEKLLLQRKAMAKRSPGVKKEKKVKEAKVRECPLPFMASLVDANVCQGVSYNHGLFTQCQGDKMSNGVSMYCKKCQSQADKNASGKPDCGNIEDRMSAEYKDGKGRKPSHYGKVITKMGFTFEDARVAALSRNVELPESALAMPEKKSKSVTSVSSEKKRGRPKKASAAVEAANVSDLFAQLTTDADDISEITTSSAGKAKLTDEEKAAKKAILEAERAEKKAALEAERASKKAALEAERASKKAALEAEKASKKAALETEKAQKKAEAEAKKAAEKAEREAKRAAEKAEREAKREAEKAAKKSKTEKKSAAAPVAAPAPAPAAVAAPAPLPAPVPAPAADKPADKPAEEAPKKLKVSIVTIEGVQYYLNKATNTIMDKNTKEEIGTYDEKNKKLIPFPDDNELDVEESESEYEDE